MIKLKIGGVPEHFNLPWRLAMEEGNFRAENIHLHWEDMGGGTGQMLRGLENKTLDIAVLLTEGITKAILQGLDATILQVYVKSSLHWGIHVPYDSAITNTSQLKGKTFAISREGSGSHLMSYVLADQQHWGNGALKFNVVGDIYGGLWALEHNEAQAFLWEKYTTKPFVDQKKCRYIDEVVTPWPCFCIAVHNSILKENKEQLENMCEIVLNKAKDLKNNSNAVDMISWRYNLQSGDVRSWLRETDWNYENESFVSTFEDTVNYLIKLGLVSEKEAENYTEKLFLDVRK